MLVASARRRNRRFSAAVLISVALLSLLASACSPNGSAGAVATPPGGTSGALGQGSSAAPNTAATQTNDGGQVTVAVTWQGFEAGPVFNVALDTHSVDLDAIDLSESAVLRTDAGTEVRPTGWAAPKGGHHRSGTLTFPSATSNGAAVLGTSASSVELVIRGVAGVPERRFQWAR